MLFTEQCLHFKLHLSVTMTVPRIGSFLRKRTVFRPKPRKCMNDDNFIFDAAVAQATCFIVSLPQTACSAILRGFETRSATGRRFYERISYSGSPSRTGQAFRTYALTALHSTQPVAAYELPAAGATILRAKCGNYLRLARCADILCLCVL